MRPPNAVSSSSGPRRPSVAPREVVLGLDHDRTRHQPVWRGNCPGVRARHRHRVVAQPSLITTFKHVKGKACPSAYPKLVDTLCEHMREHHAQRVGGQVLLHPRSSRSVSCTSRCGASAPALRVSRSFLGLGLGLGAGLVFFFLGAWLIIRAYRLQKYGVAGMVASNQVAREMALARREGRGPNLAQLPSSSGASPRTSSRGSAKKPTRPKGRRLEALHP